MNLKPRIGRFASGGRPCQDGRLIGHQNGTSVAIAVEWLVDTGSEIVTVRNSVGSRLEGVPVGLSAGSTTGGGGIQVVTGLTAEFEVEDSSGAGRRVRADGYVGIKAGDTASDILGMEQMAAAGATLAWDPASGRGSLRG